MNRLGENTTPEALVHEETALFDKLAAQLYSAVISDVLDRLGYRDQSMTPEIRAAYTGARLIGRAHTMLSSDVFHVPSEPYELEIQAIDSVPVNGVVVVATNNSIRTSPWGELLSTATRARGGRGAIVDGLARDVAMIEQMGFPLFCVGTRPVDSLGRGMIVAHGNPVVCGGVVVEEGDIVFADGDGVVVIPRAVETEAIRLACEKVSGENEMREWLKQGKTLRETFDRFGFL